MKKKHCNKKRAKKLKQNCMQTKSKPHLKKNLEKSKPMAKNKNKAVANKNLHETRQNTTFCEINKTKQHHF